MSASTTMAIAGPGAPAGIPRIPGILSGGLSAIRLELRAYFRTPDTVFFTFLFPILMLGIISTISLPS